MKFWATGRIDRQIEFEIFQPVLLAIRDQINKIISDKNYGDDIVNYDVIVNIFEEPVEERFKYNPKNKDTDIDVNIVHDDFLNGDFEMRYELFLNAVLHSIDGIKSNRHLHKFDFKSFRKDLAQLGADSKSF